MGEGETGAIFVLGKRGVQNPAIEGQAYIKGVQTGIKQGGVKKLSNSTNTVRVRKTRIQWEDWF